MNLQLLSVSAFLIFSFSSCSSIDLRKPVPEIPAAYQEPELPKP